MDTEYKSNSHKIRNGEIDESDKKDIKKVIRGKATVKKEPLGKKFADTFLSEDAGNVKNYILFDILVPAIKDTIADMISNTVNMVFYSNPNGRSSGRSGNKIGGSRVSYSSYYKNDDHSRSSRISSRDRHSVNDVIFETRGDAKATLDSIYDILDRYGLLRVAEYYELAGLDDISTYTDSKYGWYQSDLDNMTITRDRDGYCIRMPRPEPLD